MPAPGPEQIIHGWMPVSSSRHGLHTDSALGAVLRSSPWRNFKGVDTTIVVRPRREAAPTGRRVAHRWPSGCAVSTTSDCPPRSLAGMRNRCGCGARARRPKKMRTARKPAFGAVLGLAVVELRPRPEGFTKICCRCDP